MVNRLIGVIIFQCTQMSNHVLYLKLMLYVNYTLIIKNTGRKTVEGEQDMK